MIKLLKKLFTKKELETSTLSESASMSDRCAGCPNRAQCCRNTANFQRKQKSDGEL